MDPQRQNLSIGLQGDDVKLLHRQLGQLGFEIPEDERNASRFGEGTRRAVITVQEANWLKPTGEVDDATSQLLTTLLSLSQLELPPRVDGSARDRSLKRIVAPINPNDSGDAVANLQEAVVFLLRRRIIRDAQDHPTLNELLQEVEALKRESQGSRFGPATRQFIFLFQRQQHLRDNLRGEVENDTAARLNELLESMRAFETSEPTFLVVRGTVFAAPGKPLVGAVVRASERDMRKDQRLGQADTNERGQYFIRYGASQFAFGDGAPASAPSLIVRAFFNDQQIGTDVIRQKPTSDEVVDFGFPTRSEWDTISASVLPLLKGQAEGDQLLPPWELNETDLDFIAERTSLASESLRLWVRAFVIGRDIVQAASADKADAVAKSHQLSPDSIVSDGLSPFAMLYGWFRLGLPTELGHLLAVPSATLLTTLQTAIQQHIVPPSLNANIDDIAARIEEIKLDFKLKTPSDRTLAPLRELLSTLPASVNLEQQRALAAKLPDLRADDPKLVEKLAADPALSNHAVEITRTLRLDMLTAGHLPMVQALQPHLADEQEGALRPLATLGADQWLDLAYAHGTPGDTILPGDYAAALATQVEQLHPTAALSAHLAEGEPLGQHPALSEVSGFLRDNPKFNIVTANLNALAGDTNLDRITKPQQLVDSLLTLQRMNTLDVRWDEVAPLMEHELYSPQQILEAGPARLTALLDGQLSAARVAELHSRAEDLYNDTVGAFSAAMAPLSGPPILPSSNFIFNGGDPPKPGDLPDGGLGPPLTGPLPDTDGVGEVQLVDLATLLSSRGGAFDPTKYKFPPVPPKERPDKTPHLNLGESVAREPTLQGLFGAQEACACGHCSSVLSPAAYFVDVLQFLKNAGPKGANLLDWLLLRRPDLAYIELSCNNTNTEVPAIDLALEILENAVAFPLKVTLPPGTNIEAQLGAPVGMAVRTALEKTVRNLTGEVSATREGNVWIIVDGHRRWSLNAQAEDGLSSANGNSNPQHVSLNGVDLSTLIQALDQGTIARGAEGTFAKLFRPTYETKLSDYSVEIKPLVRGESWQTYYSSVAQLVMDDRAQRLILKDAKGVAWLEREYDSKTIKQIRSELDKNTVPLIVQKLLARKFLSTKNLTLKGDERSWTITSPTRELSLRFKPAGLTITSLAYQSGDPNADAVAWPENHNPAAYMRLRGDPANGVPIPAFPWSLPVDLPLEEVRVFLNRARCSRQTLIRLMEPVDQLLNDDPNFVLEVLGLNAAEGQLLVQPPLTNLDLFASDTFAKWGLRSGPTTIVDAAAGRKLKGAPLELLKNVSILLQQSRLDFDEFQQVIETDFVSRSGTNPLGIVPPGSCKPSEMKVPDLTVAHLDRIHRFVRLQRKLGWTAKQLDTALTLTPEAELNTEKLVGISQLKQLCELLRVKIDKILALLGSNTSAEDRMRSLARALDLTRAELDHAVLLLDVADPLSTPSVLLDFCERVIAIHRHAFAFEDLRYLLHHVETDGASIQLDTKQLLRLSSVSSESLRTVPDYVAPPPANADATALANATATRVAAETKIRRDREDAIITALATSFDAARELVDELLRVRLRHPVDSSLTAIEVFFGSPQFSSTDFKDLRDLVAQLRSVATPLTQYLMGRFSIHDRELLKDSNSSRQVLQTTLVAALAGVVEGDSIYDAARFAENPLSDETLALIAKNPSREELPSLNRQLIEEAFPKNFWSKRGLVNSVLLRLYKSIIICNTLKLGVSDLNLLRKPVLANVNGSTEPDLGFTVLNFNLLATETLKAPAQVKEFEQLISLMHLRDIALQAPDLLRQYSLLDPADNQYKVKAQRLLAVGLLGGDTSDQVDEVAAAAQQLGINIVDHYREPRVLTRLVELIVALQQLGANVADAIALVAASPDDSAALSARELLRTRYIDSGWHDLVKPIADKLRVRQRDALIDYLIAMDQIRDSPNEPSRLRDANDLYESLLIDVQTSSCMTTTRLLQATAAAQLFVQRVLLNLETGLSLSDDKRELWQWMERYRVWEANRKVFLFPENWLLPELRDDKTATFRNMESALTEQEASLALTRSALRDYLDELGDLAHISVIAMYQDRRVVGTDQQNNLIVEHTLYVIGRTPDQPYRYFWRSGAEFGRKGMSWSGWEPLELDNANDFILPFVFEGDLHVAWPILRKTKDEADKTKLLWEVQIAWTRHSQKGWVKPKIGKVQFDDVERLPNKDGSDSFVFRLSKSDSNVQFGTKLLTREQITIDCFSSKEINLLSSMSPDPSLLKDAAAKGAGVSDANLWNVDFSVSGFVYEYATINEEEKTTFSRPLAGVEVKLVYDQRWHSGGDPEGDIHRLDKSDTKTDAHGHFVISVPAPNRATQSANGREGVMNGSTVWLTFKIGSLPGGEATISQTLGNQASGFFNSWTWNTNYGVQNNVIKNSFLQGRQVKYQEFGRFVIETGRDLRLERVQTSIPLPGPAPSHSVGGISSGMSVELAVDGNRYVETSSISDISLGNDGFLLPSSQMNAPVFVIRAATSVGPMAASVEPNTWYLQDRESGYFLQRDSQSGDWRRWPDGLPFASIYRSAAAFSTSILFQPEFQAQLHIDPHLDSFAAVVPYANYNWELFLHAPLAIANHLASQLRFSEARLWLHSVFDPTVPPTGTVSRFWRFLPFDNYSQPQSIAEKLTWLADPDPKPGDSQQERQRKADVLIGLRSEIERWKKNPFMPHVIARLRPSAYQWYTFFAYLDVLINWGDQLFRLDTRESINEATLLYVLAARLLGPRPRVISPASPRPPETYHSLAVNKLDEFSNAWVTYSDLPGVKKLNGTQHTTTLALLRTSSVNNTNSKSNVGDTPKKPPTVPGLISLSSLAFCIPQNDKLNEFYDRLDQRLLYVRTCRNIDGVFRELPPYEPPIDPLLLIRARAAGLDLSSVIAGLGAPLPQYRFGFTFQKALELTAELKALGATLLSVLEKQDSEELALLRSSHEIAMLKLVSDTRKKQVAEAEANLAALQQSEETVLERFGQYQKLLGKPGITKGQDGLPVIEQSSSLAVSTDPIGGVSGLGLIRREVEQFVLSAIAHNFTQAANSMHVMAGILSMIPNIWAGDALVAGQTFGGANLGSGASAIAKSVEMGAADASFVANQMGIFGGYERRQDEWVHQSKLALAELKQIKKQTLGAEIRKAVADLELRNHDSQIENAKQVDDFMHEKFTNKQLYRWMSSQIADVYFRTYQLALDQAKRAERAYQHELGINPATTSFVQVGYWDNLRKGLLAGEQLHIDLKRMESAFLDQNKREYEITKHLSLVQLDPLGFVALKETGQCKLSLSEAAFDIDFPGHYLRRIKTVSVTIPCVGGPYTSVPCTLTLLKTTVRQSSNGSGEYVRDLENDDPRFTDSYGPIQSIVTSNAQNDTGLFETNLRDERYLPFEGAGAISTWRIQLPSEFHQFDYATIADVILHIRYTARDGGESLRDNAVASLKTRIQKAEAVGSVRLFSVRHEFPTDWAKFQAQTPAADQRFKLTLNLRPEHYPFWSQGRLDKVSRIDILARSAEDPIPAKLDVFDAGDKAAASKTEVLVQGAATGTLLVGHFKEGATGIAMPKNPVTALNLYFENKAITDLWICVTWGSKP